MLDILNDLTKTDYIILSILALVIIFAGIILIIFLTHKSKKKIVIDKFVETIITKEEEKKPEVKIALAAENIEDIEKVINRKDGNKKPKIKEIKEIKNDAEIEPGEVELKPDISMALAVDYNKIDDEEQKMREQDMKNQTSIEEVLKAMELDLEKEKFAKIDAYEEEQEKEAVITYQELRDKMNAKKKEEILENDINTTSYNNAFFDILDTNEVTEKKEEIIKPNDYDLITTIDLPNEEIIDEKYEPYELRNEVYQRETGKYQGKLETKEFVSPVFGKQNEDFVYPEIREIKREEKNSVKDISLATETDDFLNTLKEFRNSL